MNTERTILLAEDNADHAIILCQALKAAGFNNPVQVVPDGEQSIFYLSGKGKYADRKIYPLPAILLLDLTLPMLNGFDVLNWLRGQPSPLRRLPVVVLATSSNEPDIARAYNAGANSFLVKPTDRSEFVNQMKSLGEFWITHCAIPELPLELLGPADR
jgi:CheY-like chemotaxis protein